MPSLLQQATDLHNQGHMAAAEALYRSALSDNPKQPDALALLGVLLGARQDFDQAIFYLTQAIEIDPEAPLFHFHHGNILLDMGQYEAAAMAFHNALSLHSEFAEAHYKLAIVLEKRAMIDEAATHLRAAAQIKPSESHIWVKLSELSFKNKEYAQAEQAARTAVRLAPQNLSAQIALALAQDVLDKEEAAVVSLRRALHIDPGFLEAWDMLGTTYQKLNKLDESEMVFKKALEISNSSLLTAAAPEALEESLTPQHWNYSILQLLRGNFELGFNLYRARFNNNDHVPRPQFPRSLWKGEDLKGKKILIVGEQGLGDVLMMCRYAPLLKAKGAHVTLMVNDALNSFLKKACLADDVISTPPLKDGDFDYQTSIFDLPLRLKTRPETIPATPYLPTPPANQATALPSADKAKIGIVWAGKKEFGDNRRRSIPLAAFANIFLEKDAAFYSLARERSTEEARVLTRYSVTDLSEKLGNFLATAQFVGQMDLIITCDTAVAHLAGGMGKPVWTLLPFAPDWRWQTKREDSPWYPTMRLFRQNRKADWPEVIERVRNELSSMLDKKRKSIKTPAIDS